MEGIRGEIEKRFSERPAQVFMSILDKDTPDFPEVYVAFSKCLQIFAHKSGGFPLVFCNVLTPPWLHVLANTISGNRYQHDVFATCSGWSM